MPWHVGKSADCPASKPHAVIKDSDGSVVGCHETKEKATKQLAALNAKEGTMSQTIETNSRPPRDNLFRAVYPGVELRAAEDGREPTLFGHFARFNEWTEIDSIFEGHFMERFAPGAFKKTISENRQAMRVLFQHGRDPQIGDKPLGPIRDLREDDEGAYYEVPLLDAPYVREQLLPGLEAGLYGASFRFSVMREERDKTPKASEHNPDGIPERTVKEATVPEFGPVTFPAYAGASAGVRSITDEFFVQRLATQPERLRRLIEWLDEDPQDRKDNNAPPTDDAEPNAHLASGRRDLYGNRKKEAPSWRL